MSWAEPARTLNQFLIKNWNALVSISDTIKAVYVAANNWAILSYACGVTYILQNVYRVSSGSPVSSQPAGTCTGYAYVPLCVNTCGNMCAIVTQNDCVFPTHTNPDQDKELWWRRMNERWMKNLDPTIHLFLFCRFLDWSGHTNQQQNPHHGGKLGLNGKCARIIRGIGRYQRCTSS